MSRPLRDRMDLTVEVARTIADLAGVDTISANETAEALQFRMT